MQVIVRRRTVEVAVLKTPGLQAHEITILFLVEAVVMGILGSLFGIVLGRSVTFFIRGVAEQLLTTSLLFVLAPQPAVTGLLVGVIVTAVFGFLPTLTAGQVRPGVVLRPTDAILPKAGWLQTLLALAVIILALSLIVQGMIGSFATALQLIIGVFITAGLLYLVLSLLIWLIGRFFPSFGLIDLKIALRQMLVARGRASMTLLALVVGVFSLSTTTLLSDSISNLLQFSLEEASLASWVRIYGLMNNVPSITREPLRSMVQRLSPNTSKELKIIYGRFPPIMFFCEDGSDWQAGHFLPYEYLRFFWHLYPCAHLRYNLPAHLKIAAFNAALLLASVHFS